MVTIKHDGEVKARTATLNEAFGKLLWLQSGSVDMALRYEGWTAVDEETGEKLEPYSGPVMRKDANGSWVSK